MIHDAVLDYYGRRLATCSSDKTIKIFEVDGESHRLTETLKGHEGAVWCVSWAHPKFGTILASSSYDGRVLIWRETPSGSPSQPSQWSLVFSYTSHTASVNMVSWAPPALGCLLACASSDGNVSVLEFRDNNWNSAIFHAHGLGVNAVSWAPAGLAGSLARKDGGNSPILRRFATGGSDNQVKIWEFSSQTLSYNLIATLPDGHSDWVRDVAWSPTLLSSKNYIASASQDKTVRIWTSTSSGAGDGQWSLAKVLEFDSVCWRASWSMSGNVLAVSGGDNKVTLWKETLKGGWECVREVTE